MFFHMATKTMSLSNHSCKNICKQIHESFEQQINNHLLQELSSLKHLDFRKIREIYMEMYGEDLYNRLKNDENVAGISSKTCEALCMLMLNPHERDAMVARDALEQFYVNYKGLVEIFTCRKSSHVLLIQQAYQARFKRVLDQDIIRIEPSTPCQKILMALSASHKAHNVDVSQHIAKCDARRLYQAGEGRLGGVDEAVVLEILSKRSISQLKLTFSSYKHIYGHSFTSSLRNRICGEFEDALQAVVKCISSPSKHYAETLYGSLKGTTNDKGALIRVMVSRAEIDMDEIQRVFRKKYGMELKCAIFENIAEDDYKHFLVSLTAKAYSNGANSR